MAKYQEVLKRLHQQKVDVVKTAQNYMSFLKTAAWNYKYSFDNQLLIADQKPMATACADIPLWNKLGRYVNKGTKGIALLDDVEGNQKLRYVFDVSDTRGRIFETTWRMKKEYEQKVVDRLRERFGEVSDFNSDIVTTVFDTASLAMEQNEKRVSTNVYDEFIKNSVAFMVLERCGYDTAEFFDDNTFKVFVAAEDISSVGNDVSDTAEVILREISKTVTLLRKQEQNERSSEHGRTDIHIGGRLLHTQSNTPETAEHRQVGQSEGEVPQRVETRNIFKDDDRRNAERPLGERGQAGGGDVRQLGRADGESAGSNRGNEAQRPNDLGGLDEQHSPLGGGNSEQRADLHLTQLPTQEEQEQIIEEAEAEKVSASFASQELIDNELQRGSSFAEGKYRIYAQFLKAESTEQNAEFLSKEYGIGGYSYSGYSQSHSGKGMTISQKTDKGKTEVNLSWRQVAKRIDELMKADRYLNETEKAHYGEWLQGQEKQAELEELNGVKYAYLLPPPITAAEAVAEAEQEAAEMIYLYNEGDIVYIGADKYGIVSVGGERVVLQDEQYPLFSKTLSREEFEEKVKENPANDHLKVLVTEQTSTPKEAAAEQQPDSLTFKIGFSESPLLYTKLDTDFIELPFSVGNKLLGYIDKLQNTERVAKDVGWYKKTDFYIDTVIDGKEFSYEGRFDIGDGEGELLNHINNYYDYCLSEDCQFAKIWKKEGNYEEKLDEMRFGKDVFVPFLEKHSELTAEDEKLFAEYAAKADDFYNSAEWRLEKIQKVLNKVMSENSEDTVVLFKSSEGNYKAYGTIAKRLSDEFALPIGYKNIGFKENISVCTIPLEKTEDYIKEINESGRKVISVAIHGEGYETEVLGEDVVYVYHTEVAAETEPNAVGDYSLLSRLKADCDYFLGAGNGAEKHLWAGNVEAQIAKMRELYNSVPEKPEWLTETEIDSYEERMAPRYHVAAYHHFENGFDDKFDYYSLEEAEKAAQGYVGGTMEDDGFEYDGAAIYEIKSGMYDKCIRIYGDYPDEKAQEQVKTQELRYVLYDAFGKQYPDSIVLMKNGDFYEAMGESVAAVTQALKITQTSRTEDGTTYDLCGFPSFNLDSNVKALTDRGYNIVVADMVDGKYEPIKHESTFGADLIGKEIEEDNRKYVVESVSKSGKAELRDITFKNAVGFPISRVVNVGFVRSALEKAQEAQEVKEVKPAEDKPLKLSKPKAVQSKLGVVDLHHEIPMEQRHTFDLASNEVEAIPKRERFRRNMEAITVLKECELENRYATPEEQITLSKYVGWGGIAEAFDENNDSWADEFAELNVALSPEEYSAARASTNTAFYTPPEVIAAVYKGMAQMGFREGNILEPSCGVGNFIGMLPKTMQGSKVYGVEIDNVSAQIAQQLYQKSSIAASPFEKVQLPDSFFDAVVGNVPFGDFKVYDKRYDKHNFLIHDYFFAKAIDKVRPNGVIALITSKGTMDKKNSAVRKYIAQRADLLGAIRLPNTAFKDNAGTDVTSDILFLQKRERMIDIEPSWVHLDTDENGIAMNSYFVEHPEMICGEMVMQSGRFGMESSCKPVDRPLAELLDKAVSHIQGAYVDEDVLDDESVETAVAIAADPNVRNFSYAIVDGEVYYRENSVMILQELTATDKERIKGLVAVRDCVRRVIELQTEDYYEDDIKAEQLRLNELYDEYTKKHGLITSRANRLAFEKDNSYSLMASLEKVNDEGEFVGKADIFTKRTIKPHVAVTSVDTAEEALAVSIGETAKVDMEYMSKLTGKDEDTLYNELKGTIFINPKHSDMMSEPKYLMADEYLSGNVREKLAFARCSVETLGDEYAVNVEALEKVQPKDLTASEIKANLGAPWIPTEDIQNFMYELLDTPNYCKGYIKVNFSPYTAEWQISNKTTDRGNVKALRTYGTWRISAYKIIEETLNQRDVVIKDKETDAEGNEKLVVNVEETQIAQSKQELIKESFKEWLWKEPSRRNRLVKLYNEKFNSIRPREYDGSHLTLSGINPEIKLYPHQLNAVAHTLYGGNALLAHVVGAGKTYEMTAAAMESKRLGLCNKSLFVVPNHLTEQWGTEFLQLYPAANILVAKKKDFEPARRKKFCARIATGDYDAVIIGHSQFEKIPMSIERQIRSIEKQIDDITEGIEQAKRLQRSGAQGSGFTVKQLEKTRKSLAARLEKLNDTSRKDSVVNFEELGVDRLFIDEAHYYKNLYIYTKMRNVSGISTTEAQKSSDLFMKCQYLDELTGGKGVVFATGTPISNSMVEMYTMQRYLQYGVLQQQGLQHFDCWAATFGETTNDVELKPEGTGYRVKTKFAKFNNLPELMCMFKEVADIKTADMLKLPVPEAHYHNVAAKASDIQKEMVAALAERAERVRSGGLDPSEDNMLKITNDGRKLALDQRMIDPLLPDFEDSKVNMCVDNVYRIWHDNADTQATQLVFCDLSTPKNDGSFNIYADVKNKLIARGIPAEEIAFIHDAPTEAKKNTLFEKVRKGDVRVLLGSTQKMGAGTNVQERLIAIHNLDCPWRPSDLEQRAGRIVRQGNKNPVVDIYRYVTEDTFDAYLYQLVESKQKFISQIMTSKSPVRSIEDIDEVSLSYAEVKALATSDFRIKEKMELDNEVSKLKLLKQSYLSERYSLEDDIAQSYPNQIATAKHIIEGLEKDVECAENHPKTIGEDFCGMTVNGELLTDKKDAGQAIIDGCSKLTGGDTVKLGEYRGFTIELYFDKVLHSCMARLIGALYNPVEVGTDAIGNITRLDNAIENMSKRLEKKNLELDNLYMQIENAKAELQKPFAHEEELATKTARLNELNIALNITKSSANSQPNEDEDVDVQTKPSEVEDYDFFDEDEDYEEPEFEDEWATNNGEGEEM